MDRGKEREFRRLVLQLADGLTDTETNKLVYIYDLPREYKDKQPHVVLELMYNWHLFSASKPENLAKLMKEIKRVDLSKAVEKYIKKTRKAGSKSGGATSLEPETDPSLISSLQAKLEVLSIQSSISAHVVDQFLEMVKPTSMQRLKEVVEEAKNHVDNFRWLAKSAEVLLAIQPNLKRGTKLQHYPADQERLREWSAHAGGPDYTYIDLPAHLLQPPAGTAGPGQPAAAQMVTGLSVVRDGTKKDKPPTLPKPRAGARHSVGPRVIPQSGMNSQRKSATIGGEREQTSPFTAGHRLSSSISSSSSDESGYTDGSSALYYTGATGTGDSGFGENFPAPDLKSTSSGCTSKLSEQPERRMVSKTVSSPDSSLFEGSSDNEDDAYEHLEGVMKDAEYVNM